MSALDQELAVLRSLAARGDKEADLIVRTFDSMRKTAKSFYKATLASTGNVASLSGLAGTGLDGTPAAGDIILLKNQSTASQNGLYVAASGAWTRLVDDNGDNVISEGMLVIITKGSTLANTLWSCTNTTKPVVGTDAITFGQDAQAVGNGSIGTTQLGAAAVTYAKLDNSIFGTSQALNGAGAVDVTHRTTFFTSTGAGNALTLADGTVVGQRKSIIHAVKGASGTGVITPAHFSHALTTITLTNVRDWVELEWTGAAWDIVAYNGATFA